MKITCKTCDRYLGEVEVLIGEIVCGNSSCRGGSQFKIVSNNEDEMLRFKFTQAPKPSKSVQSKDTIVVEDK